MTDLGLKGIDFYQKEIFELKNNYIHYLHPFFNHAERVVGNYIFMERRLLNVMSSPFQTSQLCNRVEDRATVDAYVEVYKSVR